MAKNEPKYVIYYLLGSKLGWSKSEIDSMSVEEVNKMASVVLYYMEKEYGGIK